MKNKANPSVRAKAGGILLVGMLAPSLVRACACGCDVFDIGSSAMLPTGAGGMAFVQYGYQDQTRNWSSTSAASAANNDDKQIQTQFLMFGLQYLFNHNWGFQAELPYDFRLFKGADDAGHLFTRNWSQFGDLRVTGIYTGFFEDLSAGLTFGLKLPTGNHAFDLVFVDRDTQLGTGSTDLLLGGFFRGKVIRDTPWDWFAQLQLDVPVLSQSAYRPGLELETAVAIDYTGFTLGRARISPLAQMIFSGRTSDSGANAAHPVASGYQRILLSPGIEVHLPPVKINADVEFPVFQNFTGNQLTAPLLFKMSLGWMF